MRVDYKARFLYSIYEEKYAIIPYLISGAKTDGDWHLADEHIGICYSVGYMQRNVLRYVKLKEDDVLLHEEDLKIKIEPSNKVRINNEIVTIIDSVINLDGTIDYYTDKKEFIPINTRDTYFDERVERSEEVEKRMKNFFKEERCEPMEYAKPLPPEGHFEYENFTGTEKEHNFWKRIFKK